MFGENPFGLHEEWLAEGQKLIASGRDAYNSKSATDYDGAIHILKMVAYALIPEGEDLDTLFNKALESARNDFTHLAWHMEAKRNER